MDLHIEGIEFRNFRSYPHLELQGLGNLTVLVGRNAVGKTNILEGIQLLTSATSFRHPQISQLITEGRDTSRLSMTSTDGNRLLETALSMERGKRRYTVNGKAKAAADVRGVLPSVVFSPDDLQLAKKTSSVKRAAFDGAGAQLSKSYYTVLQDYEKVVRYKNRLLKDEASEALIASINETLVTCASQLYVYRKALFDRFVPKMAEYYKSISDGTEAFSARYIPSWSYVDDGAGEPVVDQFSRDDVRLLLEESLFSHASDERARKRSLVGPHNDKIYFDLAGRDASDFASQGQQRSIVLAFKLAEVDLVENTLHQHPVLLLDDVMSELDERRRDLLVQFVRDDLQTFITATDLSAFNAQLLDKSQVINLPLADCRTESPSAQAFAACAGEGSDYTPAPEGEVRS